MKDEKKKKEPFFSDILKLFSKENLQVGFGYALIILKWIVFAVICGVVVGFAMAAFWYCLKYVTEFRLENNWMLLFMPLGGVIIVYLYKLLNEEQNKGTDGIIESVNTGRHISVKTFPLIFVTTVITHAVGGSAGREGAALQIGGSIADGMSRFAKIDRGDRRILVMCGMSAAFAALFGTPFAAIIFAMEVACVGAMHYSAFIPCAVSSLISTGIANMLGINGEHFAVSAIPKLTVVNGIETAVVGVLCAFVSIFFCVAMRFAAKKLQQYFKNPYIRVAVAGAFLAAVSLLIGTQDFNGAGMFVIERCFLAGDVAWYTFIVKIIFTAITLGAGFRGGEIIPTLYVGATFGHVLGGVFGLPVELCSAIGMCAVFCGVTNCPLASIIICLELFGFGGMPFYLLAVAMSFVVSGKFGLYKGQTHLFSKYNMDYDSELY